MGYVQNFQRNAKFGSHNFSAVRHFVTFIELHVDRALA